MARAGGWTVGGAVLLALLCACTQEQRYVVAAENTLMDVSADSDEASATPMVFVPDPPDVPANLAVTPGNSRNFLNWDDNSQQGFLEFRVQRAVVMGGPYTQIGITAQSAFTAGINSRIRPPAPQASMPGTSRSYS